MARTKQTARKSTGVKSCSWPACYQKNLMEKHPPSTRRPYSLRKRDAKQHVVPSLKSSTTFPMFAKLPEELRARIWQMATEDGRLVAVRSTIKGGLTAPVPPMLHVCSASRAIGLKQYAPSFAALTDPYSEETVPARVYFNFDRDTLYFGQGWNHRVDGPWSCISQFRILIMNGDLQKVKSVGFALNAKACSTRSTSDHIPGFGDWTGLKTLYLALEEPSVDVASERELCELRSDDDLSFLRSYRDSQSVVNIWEGFDEVAAMEEIRNRTICRYLGHDFPPEGHSAVVYPARVVEV